MIISQWFPPEPVHKGAELARALMDRGHEVIAITGFPNYPSGRVYDGYRVRPTRRQSVEGIPTIRVPLFPSHDRSGWKRVLNYVSFAVSAAVVAPWVSPRVDVAYVYHPPATVGLPALVLQVLRRVPFVIDVQDLWPDTLAATRMVSNRRVLAGVSAWMSLVYRRAAAIVVLSPGFERILEQRGVSGDKLTVVFNWSLGQSTGDAPSLLAPRATPSEFFSVVFTGNLGDAQGLFAVVDAAKILARSHPDVRIVLAGDGVAAADIECRIMDLGLDNIVVLPRLDALRASELQRGADALLVHLRDDPLFGITIPSKTQAYLAAGRPIVMAVDGDAANLVTSARAGVVCRPENPRSIANAIAELHALPEAEREDMGRRGRAFYEERLSIHRAVDQLIGIFESVRSKPSDRMRASSRRFAIR